jgi:hypothetical protein
VTAADNSDQDATFVEDIPAGIVLPNVLTVGAVDRAGDEASFTSYGPTVVAHADGRRMLIDPKKAVATAEGRRG